MDVDSGKTYRHMLVLEALGKYAIDNFSVLLFDSSRGGRENAECRLTKASIW